VFGIVFKRSPPGFFRAVDGGTGERPLKGGPSPSH